MSSLSLAAAEPSTPVNISETALAYLRHHDDPLRWETPRMFNRCAELRRLERFVASLESVMGRRLDYELGSGLDEASFHGDVFIEGATVRFSNFGRMVAILGGTTLSADTRRQIAQVVQEHNYILIPNSLLAVPHPSPLGDVRVGETWGSRFFGAL